MHVGADNRDCNFVNETKPLSDNKDEAQKLDT